MTDSTHPLCMTCRRIPGAKRVPSSNGRAMMWKCASCIARRSVSFLYPEENKRGKLWGKDK
jgi:hypothetical protein